MPTLRQLDYLVALAETLHFRRAAERVHTTQSTLSTQLKALEDRLGAQLIDRSSVCVSLTPVGRQVVPVAQRMLRDAQVIRDIAKAFGPALAAGVRLGIPGALSPFLLPIVAAQLRRSKPNLKLTAVEQSLPQLHQALADGALDLIISPWPVARDGFAGMALLTEQVYLVVPCDHALASANDIQWCDLAGVDVLALSPAHELDTLVRLRCEHSGAQLRDDYAGTSLDTLRELVLAGAGVAFFPGLYVESTCRNMCGLTVRDVAEASPLRHTIGLAWRNASPCAAAYGQLAALIKDALAGAHPEFVATTQVTAQ